MLKSFFAFLFLLCTAVSCCSSPVDSLKGNVNTMNVFSLKEKNTGDKISYDSLFLTQKLFNRSGNILEDVLYDNDGGIARAIRCKYNEKGNKTEETILDGSGKQQSKKAFKYSDKGKLVEEISFEKDDEYEYKINFTYDRLGNKTAELKSRGGGEIIKKSLYKYDDRKNLLEEKVINDLGVVEIKNTFKYDLKNNKIEETRFEGDDQQWKIIFSYSSENKKTSEQHFYNFEKSNNKIEWKYDAAQHLTEEITYDWQNKILQKNVSTYINGKLMFEEKNNTLKEYKYDGAGNKTKEKISSHNKTESEIFYDAKGNALSWKHYNAGALSYTEINFFDTSHTQLTRMTKRDKQNIVTEDNLYSYDSKGNITEEINKGSDEKMLFRKVYVYIYY